MSSSLRVGRALGLPLVVLLSVAACDSGPGAEDRAPETLSQPSAPGEPPSPPGAGDVDACPVLGTLASRRGDLRAFLRKVPITLPGSGDFEAPTPLELQRFERAFGRLLGDPTSGKAELEALGFEVTAFVEGSSAPWLVVQDATPGRGGGTFVVNSAPARNLWLEAPHADSDQGTLEQSADALVLLGARALVITGANRCADARPTPCADGVATRACGGTMRVSDAAHFEDNFFTAAHRALREAHPAALAVSVHGMDASGPEAAVVSDGTSRPRRGALSQKVRDALNARLEGGRRAFSCNDAGEGGFRPLCGSTNVQGRIDNGSSNVCTRSSVRANDRFLHVEQGPELRGMRGPAELARVLAEALGEAVPCSLGGAGLGCAAVASASARCL